MATTTFIDDNFTDTAGVLLSAHTPDVIGETWVKHSLANASVNMQFIDTSNVGTGGASSQTALYYSPTVFDVNRYTWASCSFTYKLPASPINSFVRICFAVDTAALTYYFAEIQGFEGNCRVGRSVAGTETFSSTAAHGVSANTTAAFTVTCSKDGFVQIYKGSTLLLAALAAPYNAAGPTWLGRVGVASQSSTTSYANAAQLSNVTFKYAHTPATLYGAGSSSLALPTRGTPTSWSTPGIVKVALGPFKRRVNYMLNGGFETTVNGWSETACTSALDTTIFHAAGGGLSSLKVTKTTGTSSAGMFIPTTYRLAIVNGGNRTFTLSGWLYQNMGTTKHLRVSVGFNDPSATQIGGASISSITLTSGVWTQFALTFTLPSGTDYITMNVLSLAFNDPDVGDIWYMDDFLLEEGEAALSYFDGSSPNAAYVGWWQPPYGKIWPEMIGSPAAEGSGISFESASFMVEHSQTNLVTNPSFETNITSWAGNSSGATIAQSSEDFLFGGNSLKVVCDGSASGQGARIASGIVAISSGINYAISCYVKAAPGFEGKQLIWSIFAYNSSNVGGEIKNVNPAVTLTNKWQRITTFVNITDVTHVWLGPKLIYGTSVTNIPCTFYMDGFQVEPNYVGPTSYVDGSMGSSSDYGWTGTANASTSQRKLITGVKVPPEGLVMSDRGAIAFWWYSGSDLEQTPWIWGVGRVFTGNMELGARIFNSPGSQIDIISYKDSSSLETLRTGAVLWNTWYHFYCDWDGTAVRVSLNNETPTAHTRAVYTYPNAFHSGAVENLMLGNVPNAAGTGGTMMFNNIMVFDRPLTDDERTILYKDALTSSVEIFPDVIVRPSSDISAGSWTTSPFFSKLDEPAPMDADFAQSSANPSADVMEVKLSSTPDPNSSLTHTVRYRVQATDTSASVNLVVGLYQGTTLIKSWTHTGLTTTLTTFEQTLTTTEANSITDYSNLRLRFTGG